MKTSKNFWKATIPEPSKVETMIKEKDILDKTHYGLNIYSHILREYYPGEIVVKLSGKECAPAKNPFNENKLTLKLINEDWVFMYSDLKQGRI